MTIKEARKIEREFYGNQRPSEEDVFEYTEAMNFLIDKEQNPQDMLGLGGYYYEIKRFDLALKYYEMAAAFDYTPAYECLGYIWYYGRTGERNYRKAFEYYSRAAERGSIVCAYKLADMYKNGYYVEKDSSKYRKIIENLYPQVKNAKYVSDPLPEIFTRLARIRKDDGDYGAALELYYQAKDFLAQRIRYNAFFGNLNIMKWMVEDIYTMTEFDEYDFDLYDLYYLLKKPVTVVFEYEGKTFTVQASGEGESYEISFEGKWYRTIDDFFARGCVEDHKLTEVYNDLYCFEIVDGGE